MKFQGDYFALSIVKDGYGYPVYLNEEQKEMFNMFMTNVIGEVTIGEEPTAKVMTYKEFKAMKEGK